MTGISLLYTSNTAFANFRDIKYPSVATTMTAIKKVYATLNLPLPFFDLTFLSITFAFFGLDSISSSTSRFSVSSDE